MAPNLVKKRLIEYSLFLSLKYYKAINYQVNLFLILFVIDSYTHQEYHKNQSHQR